MQTPAVKLLQKFPLLPASLRVGITGVLIVVVAGALLVYHNQAQSDIKKSIDVPTIPGSFHPTKEQLEALTITPVQLSNFRSEQITDGNIASNDEATTPVLSPYSGHVSKLFAKLGDVVSKGTPLMAVEASEFVQGQTDLTSAVAMLKNVRAQFKLVQSAEQRQHALLIAKAGALKDWLQSQADLVAAESNLRSAEISLSAVRSRLLILGKSVQEISLLETESADKQMHLEAVVRSPINGTVILRQVGLGQNIQSVASGSAVPVYTIANLSTVWLIANVREADALLIKIAAPIEVAVLALPGRIFKAKIAWIAPSIDSNTHRLSVRAELENRDGALKPAMFATFHILTGETSVSPGVPKHAIVFEGANAHVFVADKDSNIMLRPIEIGRTNDDLVEVTSGLKAGEKVVTSGALFIDRALESN